MNIIPQPLQMTPSEGQYIITPSTRIFVSPDSNTVGEALQKILPFPLGQEQTLGNALTPGNILLSTIHADEALGPEGYILTVSPEGIVIRANQPAGLFYGVQTLRQLLTATNTLPAVEIVDRPRFPWRGIMLDVGRHLFPLEFIFRLLDTMALHKLNVLHWHLTEDQGWRIEIKKYPRLTEIGANRSASPFPADRDRLDGVPYGGFYTQEQVRQVVAYAASRFITVVPEIEMPGHSVAALASYPQLGCTGGPYAVRTFWGIADDVYCAGNEQTFTFLQDVLDEVLALFPSQIIHIGGDESPKVRWQACPKCQEAIRQNNLKDEHELQSYFIRRIEAYLNQKGRRLIGWDEILEGGLAPNASVMSWRGMEGGIQAVRQGHDVVMTPTDYCYLDYYQSEDTDHEPPAIGGFVPLERSYTFEPVPPELSAEEGQHILGLQGNLWSEYIATPEQAEYMLFPRATALAEIAWSPAVRCDFADFERRLESFLPLLKQMNVRYHP
jgi:hexosaminidase